MSDALQDLSPQSLTSAIEANLFSWLPLLSVMGRLKDNDPPGVKRVISNVTMALFNSVMDARLAQDNVDATIQLIVSDAQKFKVPILWWIGPSSQPEDLETYLEKHGFNLDDDGPGMAVDLAELNEDLPSPTGLSIQAVESDADRMAWCKTMALGFGIPPARADYAAKNWQNLLSRLDPNNVTSYTAWLDGKPVATSMLNLGGGVAGIYAVATIPEARRRGIGALVTLRPLLDARTKGYKAGTLQASEMGEGVYRSLGFKEYCRIRSYRFQP